MSNPRDTGRYDSMTDSYINQEVRVDFAWGNIPMQPNDDRETHLDPELDSHIIATSGYEGFPAFITGAPYDDTITNVAVPNLVGLEDPTAAQEALENVGLVLGDTNSSSEGAGVGNDGTVKSQTPAAGTFVNLGATVDIVVYDNPQVAVPNLIGLNIQQVGTALTNVGLVGANTMTTDGATQLNNGLVKSQVIAAGTMVDPGTTINYVLYNYVAINYNIAGIRSAGATVTQRYLYLRGRNSGIIAGNQITLLNTGVANYNRPFDVISIVNDDSFNTGGQKLLIQNGLMDGTGGDVTDVGTYTKP